MINFLHNKEKQWKSVDFRNFWHKFLWKSLTKISQSRMQAKKTFFCLFLLSCFFHHVCVEEHITKGINSGDQDKQLTSTKIIAIAKEKQSQSRMKKTSKIHCCFFCWISLWKILLVDKTNMIVTSNYALLPFVGFLDKKNTTLGSLLWATALTVTKYYDLTIINKNGYLHPSFGKLCF